MTEAGPTTVLVVDDEPSLVDLYRRWLDGDHDVRTATGGTEALDELTADVDVVLLDRQMPGLSGDDVLDAIREREVDCRVAMVTATDPGLDVVDLPFDDYLTKPVSEAELRRAVQRLDALNEHESLVREYFALATKVAALEATYPESTLADSEEYARLQERFAAVDDRATDHVADLLGDPEGATRPILSALLTSPDRGGAATAGTDGVTTD